MGMGKVAWTISVCSDCGQLQNETCHLSGAMYIPWGYNMNVESKPHIKPLGSPEGPCRLGSGEVRGGWDVHNTRGPPGRNDSK